MMSKFRNLFTTIPQSTMRQWRSTPTYIFLTWRWGTWIFALIWYFTLPSNPAPNQIFVQRLCLIITFFYTLAVTLHAPVSRFFLTRFPGWTYKSASRKEQNLTRSLSQARRKSLDPEEETRIIGPLVNTRNVYLNVSIHVCDVLVCGLITYFSAVNSGPPFGIGSPFYRYGLSAAMAAGFSYSYGGGFLATLGYSFFVVFGALVHAPGQTIFYSVWQNPLDLAGSLIDAPLVALLAAYLANQLNKAILSKRQHQDNLRRESSLRGVSEMLITEANDQVQLLRRSVRAIRQGGHFDRLVIALIHQDPDVEPRPDFETYVEADISDEEHPDVSEELIMLVTKTGRRHASFDLLPEQPRSARYGLAYLYQPFFKEKQLYLVIGAESMRTTPFDQRQEEFLAIVGPQLIVALENIRLTEETAELATLAERSRIAREIHDGIAQLLYMLSLNGETCAALVQRAASTSADANRALAPVSQSLDTLVTISKQALWETRHYMFMLRPLIDDGMTLTQMLTNQLREFEAISGLSAHLEIEGQEEKFNGNSLRNQRLLQVGTAIFRITQEALTNAYKHASASQLEVRLRQQPAAISVEISDNGKGIAFSGYAPGSEKIYSGRGLSGMRERAVELGGTLEVSTITSGGTCVIASIPL